MKEKYINHCKSRLFKKNIFPANVGHLSIQIKIRVKKCHFCWRYLRFSKNNYFNFICLDYNSCFLSEASEVVSLVVVFVSFVGIVVLVSGVVVFVVLLTTGTGVGDGFGMRLVEL